MIPNIILDVIVVGIVLAGLIIGLKNGLVSLVFKRLRAIASLVLAVLFAKPVAKLFADRILSPVSDLLMKYVGEDISKAVDLTKEIPAVLKALAGLFGTDLGEMAQAAVDAGGTNQEIVRSFINSASVPVANMVATVLAFIGIFFVSLLVLVIVGAIINAVFKLPLLREINRILGALVGIVFFAAFAWIACKLIVFVISLLPNVEFLKNFDIAKTYVAHFLYDFDPIEYLLKIPAKY